MIPFNSLSDQYFKSVFGHFVTFWIGSLLGILNWGLSGSWRSSGSDLCSQPPVADPDSFTYSGVPAGAGRSDPGACGSSPRLWTSSAPHACA